jgi:hypothetical protein
MDRKLCEQLPGGSKGIISFSVERNEDITGCTKQECQTLESTFSSTQLMFMFMHL